MRLFKSLCLSLIASLLCLQPLGLAAKENLLPFEDVEEDAWYAKDLRDIYDLKIMSGTSASTFSPEASVDRAQLVTMLYRMQGSPAVSGRQVFYDHYAGQYYTDAVEWAYNQGIITGNGNGYFYPSQPISREDFVVMLSRYENSRQLNTKSVSFLNEYIDGPSVSAYAKPAVAWAEANGILKGTNGILEPQSVVDRAQCAVLLNRFLELAPVAADQVQSFEQRAAFYTSQVIERVGTDLRDLFDWTCNHIAFTPDIFTRSDAEYACLGYENEIANCQAYSAVFHYLASASGYSSRTCFGRVYYSDGSSDAHGYVLILNPDENKEYLYDPAEEVIFGDRASFYEVDPLNPPMRYAYPEGQEPLGGYLVF